MYITNTLNIIAIVLLIDVSQNIKKQYGDRFKKKCISTDN